MTPVKKKGRPLLWTQEEKRLLLGLIRTLDPQNTILKADAKKQADIVKKGELWAEIHKQFIGAATRKGQVIKVEQLQTLYKRMKQEYRKDVRKQDHALGTAMVGI